MCNLFGVHFYDTDVYHDGLQLLKKKGLKKNVHNVVICSRLKKKSNHRTLKSVLSLFGH